VARLTVGEGGVQSLTVLDNGWLEIATASATLLRPSSECAEGAVEFANRVLDPVARPEAAHVPEVHEAPVGPSMGLPVPEAGYIAPEPYKAPSDPRIEAHPQRKRKGR
jgi:hypothetical protein